VERVGHLLAGKRLLSREQPLLRLDERDLGPEAVPGLRHLGAHRASTQDDQAVRNRLRGGRLAVVPRLRLAQPVDRRNGRLRAGRDDDRLACDEHVVAHLHPALAVERALPAEQLDVSFLQPWELAGVVEVVDDLVAAVQRRLDVELTGHRLRRARHAPDLGERLGGPQQCLRRHARVIGALPANQVRLDDCHLQPPIGKAPGTHLPGRACPHHDGIEFPFRHKPLDRHQPRYPIGSDIARGRQASIRSIRANGCRSRFPEASLNTGKTNKCGPRVRPYRLAQTK
jgi:hypothetical protein